MYLHHTAFCESEEPLCCQVGIEKAEKILQEYETKMVCYTIVKVNILRY